MSLQDLAAFAIVLAAALYLVQHLTGWPWRRRRTPQPTVKLGARLERGLKRKQ
jgi:hypothetical protein